MKTYEFELVLAEPTTDEDDERLFARFSGRLSSAVVHGVGVLYAHIEADSMETAMRETVQGVTTLGLTIRRIEVDPTPLVSDAA